MPRVSVLLPVYNTKEEYLRAALDSVLNQTFQDFELLIVNDCSTDENVGRVVRSYDDPRIRYVENEENLGISKTRNRLIDLAQGEYLAVMDHDDISLSQRLEKQAAYLDAHPSVGVVGCKIEKFPVGGVSKNPTENEQIKLALMRTSAVPHSAAMIRKKVLTDNNIRYEEKFSPSEDYALWCRLLSKTDFYNIPEVLFRYRWHESNTSKKQAERMRQTAYAIQSFVAEENPALYNEFLLKATHTFRFRLFGFLPIVTVKRKGYHTTVYLFEKIPLLSWKSVIKLQEK